MGGITTLDNAAAGWVVQSMNAGSTPLYDYGITGQGEVINVVDTGLDEGSCFFSHDGNTHRPKLSRIRTTFAVKNAGENGENHSENQSESEAGSFPRRIFNERVRIFCRKSKRWILSKTLPSWSQVMRLTRCHALPTTYEPRRSDSMTRTQHV